MIQQIVLGASKQFGTSGPFMWVILIVLGIALAVVLERVAYYFIVCRGDSRKLSFTIARAIGANDIARARELAQKRSTPLFALLRTAIDRYAAGQGLAAIEESVEETAIREIPKMSRRINYLALFANIATLLGLLGTIAGLQVSFGSLASVDAAQKASMLASGISQAMNTTAFGLIVAIPCMACHTILNNKQQALTNEIDEAVVRVLGTMKEGRA
jgi:biopolymer transport protein ExbB/TolQ